MRSMTTMLESSSFLSQFPYYDGDIKKSLIPENMTLTPNTHGVFELDLAYGEAKTLEKQGLIRRGAYFCKIDDTFTNHYKMCLLTPMEAIGNSSIRTKSFFLKHRFSTGYATHSLFPYRGKFHPQMIKAIMNVIRIREGDKILDPMMGSGTTCVEASVIGVNSVGIELSPFCCLMARAKIKGLSVQSEKLVHYLDESEFLCKYIEEKRKKGKLDTDILNDIWVERDMQEILLLSYFDAMGYARRVNNGRIDKLFHRVLERYCKTINGFEKARRDLMINLGKVDLMIGDAKKIELNDDSVDGIITSPPYSFAIDYVNNDKPQLESLGVNTDKLKNEMIGLRGKSKGEKITNYFKDMDEVIAEMSRVLKPGKCCVIIVGSNEIQTGGIRHEIEFKKFAKKHGMKLFKEIIKSIDGIRNTLTEENILFFVKE